MNARDTALNDTIDHIAVALPARLEHWRNGTISHGEMIGHLACLLAAIVHLELPDRIR
jgi:hypothetical protein